MTLKMRRFSLRALLLATAFVAAVALPAAAEEKSLLAADGTLYEVHAGLAVDRGNAIVSFIVRHVARRLCKLPEKRYAVTVHYLSGRRESNPHNQFGRLRLCH